VTTCDSSSTPSATTRAASTERLKGSTIDVAFDVDLQGAPTLPQRTQLQLLRIVQEAVANALRHAAAKTITVHARWLANDGAVVLAVDDDGRGFAPPSAPSAGAAPVAGRGLTNMARRARSIGATLTFEPRTPGTRVQVRWEATTATTTASVR
jgi:signal transduction histidine kinase